MIWASIFQCTLGPMDGKDGSASSSSLLINLEHIQVCVCSYFKDAAYTISLILFILAKRN